MGIVIEACHGVMFSSLLLESSTCAFFYGTSSCQFLEVSSSSLYANYICVGAIDHASVAVVYDIDLSRASSCLSVKLHVCFTWLT